jgi:hypothetical protein
MKDPYELNYEAVSPDDFLTPEERRRLKRAKRDGHSLYEPRNTQAPLTAPDPRIPDPLKLTTKERRSHGLPVYPGLGEPSRDAWCAVMEASNNARFLRAVPVDGKWWLLEVAGINIHRATLAHWSKLGMVREMNRTNENARYLFLERLIDPPTAPTTPTSK